MFREQMIRVNYKVAEDEQSHRFAVFFQIETTLITWWLLFKHVKFLLERRLPLCGYKEHTETSYNCYIFGAIALQESFDPLMQKYLRKI